LESVMLAIAGCYIPDDKLPLFFLYLGATANAVDTAEGPTTH